MRNNFAFVPQKVLLMEGTLRENILFGTKLTNANKDFFEKVLSLAKLSEIIEIEDEAKAASGIFDGKTFCITGSLSRPRKEIALFIKNLGGKVVGSVSSNLDILIAGEKAGSKLSKAQSLGIEVWSEDILYGRNEPEQKAPKTLFDYDL